MKFYTNLLPKTRDTDEYEIKLEDVNKTYTAIVEITGQRLAIDNHKSPISYLKIAEGKFRKLIEQEKITPKDRLKFGFFSDGDFVVNQEQKGQVELHGTVVKYAADRLHIEIPKTFRNFFKEGEEIIIQKNTF